MHKETTECSILCLSHAPTSKKETTLFLYNLITVQPAVKSLYKDHSYTKNIEISLKKTREQSITNMNIHISFIYFPFCCLQSKEKCPCLVFLSTKFSTINQNSVFTNRDITNVGFK